MNIEKINAPKTPISILTELMVKKCSIPKWELIHDGGGTHENIFIWRVTCDGMLADGEGRNKRDAKHLAATKMLELLGQHSALLQLPAVQNPPPVRTPQPVEPPSRSRSPTSGFRNTVGELKDLCGYNNLDDPKYRETSDVGPPHARVFTIECSVSTFTEEGVAKTKKQAKHEAAWKMLDRILGNLESIKKDHQIVTSAYDDDVDMADAKVAELYPQLSLNHCNEQSKLKVNLGIKIKDYHKSFKEYFVIEDSKYVFLENIESILDNIEKCKNNFSEDGYKELKDQFKELLDSIDVKCYESKLDSTDANSHIYCLTVNTAPDIVEIALGKTEIEACLETFKNALESIKLLLK